MSKKAKIEEQPKEQDTKVSEPVVVETKDTVTEQIKQEAKQKAPRKPVHQVFMIGNGFPAPLVEAFDLLSPHPIDGVRVPLKQYFENVHNYIAAPRLRYHVEKELKSEHPTSASKMLILAIAIALAQDHNLQMQKLSDPKFLKALQEWLGLDKAGIEIIVSGRTIILDDGKSRQSLYTVPQENHTYQSQEVEDLMKELADATKDLNETLERHEKEWADFNQECEEKFEDIIIQLPGMEEFKQMAQSSPENKAIYNKMISETTNEAMARASTKNERIEKLTQEIGKKAEFKGSQAEIDSVVNQRAALTDEIFNAALLAKVIDVKNAAQSNDYFDIEQLIFSEATPTVESLTTATKTGSEKGESIANAMTSQETESSTKGRKIEESQTRTIKEKKETLEGINTRVEEISHKQKNSEELRK